MELPHCSAMWWQHSRSAGVIVAPGRTHAMAGVTAHSRAIVRSANARILVTLMSVTLPLSSTNRLTTNTVLPLLADKGCGSDHSALLNNFGAVGARQPFAIPSSSGHRWCSIAPLLTTRTCRAARHSMCSADDGHQAFKKSTSRAMVTSLPMRMPTHPRVPGQ
jgi:hypothetical protein